MSAKATAGILVFVVCCLLSTFRIARDAPNPAHLNPDDVSQLSDQRFAPLKSRLPPQGVVGYIGEAGDSATPDYYLAQYALAPLVVDRSTGHDFVVGNFPASTPASPPPGLHLVVDFGHGVLLFRSEDAR